MTASDAVDGSPPPAAVLPPAELEENHGSGCYDRLDIAKSVFQVHGVDAQGGVVVRQRRTRKFESQE